jgi:ubiquitin-like-conjugating enzyme ATG3
MHPQAKARKDLPADKQYLQTRDVPCLPHPSSDASLGEERIIEEDGDEDGGWVEAGGMDSAEPELGGGGGAAVGDGGDDDGVPEIGGGDGAAGGGGGGAAAATAADDDDDDDDDDDVPELDEFDYDEAAVADNDPASAPTPAAGTAAEAENVVKTRTYDISVTYDAHYSTPRVWLFGYVLFSLGVFEG